MSERTLPFNAVQTAQQLYRERKKKDYRQAKEPEVHFEFCAFSVESSSQVFPQGQKPTLLEFIKTPGGGK